MIKKVINGTILSGLISLLLLSISFADDAFERELVVKDQTRVMKVEAVFKQLLQAYEDENPNDFLALVSDERFRQDYITFTDALYSDFRKYEIKDVTYWIDRVTSDHIKQFLYVKWEKRYVDLNDGRSGMTTGFSRFLFDEVNGKYLLIELAGNTLFGGSLQEWRDETPKISGEVRGSSKTPATGDCTASSLGGCVETNCASVGGYWYNNQCNSTMQVGQADLTFDEVGTFVDHTSVSMPLINYKIVNEGNIASTPCTLQVNMIEFTGAPATPRIINIGSIAAGGAYSSSVEVYNNITNVVIDSGFTVSESNEVNNTWTPAPY